MSEESKKYTLEEKTKIALEASSGNEGSIADVAKKYGVSVSKIEEWINETGVGSVEASDDEESVDLEVTEELANDYNFGATPDKLNYPRLTFWSIFGTSVMLIIVVAIFYIYDYTFDGAGQAASESSEYYQIGQIMERDQNKLNSFGVVDLEEGVYRMPIDSVITRMATDSE